MIKVNVLKQTNYIKQIVVSGHANYKKHGEDIVCAGVSAITQGGIIALEQLLTKGDKSFEYDVKEGYINIQVIEFNEKLQLILETMLVQLSAIESSYKKFIKITHKEVN